jgi:ribonuclease R
LSKYPYPIPSREEILACCVSDAPLAANDIAEALSIKRQSARVFRRVAAMEARRPDPPRQARHYQLTHPSNFVAGRVQGHRDGYAS